MKSDSEWKTGLIKASASIALFMSSCSDASPEFIPASLKRSPAHSKETRSGWYVLYVVLPATEGALFPWASYLASELRARSPSRRRSRM